MMISGRRVGQRIVGPQGYGIITALGTLRGEAVVYVLWDTPNWSGENSEWRDTVRARDVVPLNAS
ncbi:hypothetical protein ACQEVF_25135 [Nonomuraea polychroma]|uniref:hypothetical protein n=1 Tax=Nonomuraea polychroma TaxID=46176 RepID=UPI003D94A9C8